MHVSACQVGLSGALQCCGPILVDAYYCMPMHAVIVATPGMLQEAGERYVLSS